MAMASMGKAKVFGLIIDRREIGDPGAFDNMTDEELVEQAKKRASALGLPASKHQLDAGSSLNKCNQLTCNTPAKRRLLATWLRRPQQQEL